MVNRKRVGGVRMEGEVSRQERDGGGKEEGEEQEGGNLNYEKKSK